MSRALAPDDLLVALETSGAVGTVAVGTAGGTVRGEVRLEERRQHAARLVPAVAEALEEAGVALGELAGVVVGAGPGSFTGVRVAAATAKGLAHSLGIPLRAVCSLAAAALAGDAVARAAAAAGDGEEAGGGEGVEALPPVRYVLFDARGDRVYGACYRVDADGVETLASPHGGTVGDVLGGTVPEGALFLGEGAVRHAETLAAAGHPVGEPPLGRPDARALLRYLALEPGTEPVPDPGRWEPAYLRASNAEREWNG